MALILKIKRPCPSLEEVENYLRANGWWIEKVESNVDGPVFNKWRNETGHGLRTPVDAHFVDFEHRISDAIGWLAEIEKRDTLDIWESINVKV